MIYHKLDEVVGVYATSTAQGTTPKFKGQIIKIIPESEWLNKYVPEYLIQDLNSDEVYRIGQNDIDRSGYLLNEITVPEQAKTRKRQSVNEDTTSAKSTRDGHSKPSVDVVEKHTSDDSSLTDKKQPIWEDLSLF
ncbi:hypothetical protein JOC36_001532 [Weissella uvarum]|uniref:hypothetical protein n=2 Tax=Lactobacillaceae TaxID=33958 RepID=UPI001960CAA0|nr:hypothetical protein [Weissella uvarum]MBM7617939.1 hypothetical protein [Weissella uvarum]MCM0595248.1 hypothetical protein [Weissella uvarum]